MVKLMILAAIYEFTKDSKFTPIIMSGLSYQSGTDALVSVQTGGQNTNFTVSSDELWALQLGGGFIYELKEEIERVKIEIKKKDSFKKDAEDFFK